MGEAVVSGVALVLVALIGLVGVRWQTRQKNQPEPAQPVAQGMTVALTPDGGVNTWAERYFTEQQEHEGCDRLLIQNGIDVPHD